MEDHEYLIQAERIVEEAEREGVLLRLLGSVAFHLHSPKYKSFQEEAGRHFTDLDFAAYFKHNQGIRSMFERLGFVENRETAVVYARSRLLFDDPTSDLYVDVFFGKLDFCHPIPWKGRLEVDSLTLPLAELLLEKMQIVEINEKDVIDTFMLLREHPVGVTDEDEINAQRVCELCAGDWGLWRTTTMNLRKVADLRQRYAWLSERDRIVIGERIEELLGAIERKPKSLAWRLRDVVGDRVQWYQNVSEVSQ